MVTAWVRTCHKEEGSGLHVSDEPEEYPWGYGRDGARDEHLLDYMATDPAHHMQAPGRQEQHVKLCHGLRPHCPSERGSADGCKHK